MKVMTMNQYIEPLSGVLGRKNAAHLLRRATYNITHKRIEEFANYTVDQAITKLFSKPVDHMRAPIDRETSQEFIKTFENRNPTKASIRGSYHMMYSWLIGKMREDETITSKIAMLLHSIFIVGLNGSGGTYLIFDYHNMLRKYAGPDLTDGSIKTFATSYLRLTTVQYYLTNIKNTKLSPNENLAREFLELFTITPGGQVSSGIYENYTEKDVQEFSRILTGFSAMYYKDRYDVNIPFTDEIYTYQGRQNMFDVEAKIPLGRFYSSRHDYEDKTFSDRLDPGNVYKNDSRENVYGANAELKSFVDAVFANRNTARAYARRIYRFFVGRDISDSIESNFIEPVAQKLIDTNYNIRQALILVMKSKHFYDKVDGTHGDQIIGSLIKSPLDLGLTALNLFDIKVNIPTVGGTKEVAKRHYGFYINQRGYMVVSGMGLFDPENVSGYKPYYQGPDFDKLWITVAAYANRKKYANYTMAQPESDIADFVKNSSLVSDPSDADQIVAKFLEMCFVMDPPLQNSSNTEQQQRYEYFFKSLIGGNFSTNRNGAKIDWMKSWKKYLETNDNTNVNGRLKQLVKTILHSPEYQIM